MTLEAVLSSEKKTLVLVSLILMAVGLLGNFIVTIVWWTRLHPWFAHAAKSGKTVYQSLTACWVVALICLVVVIIFVIFKFAVQSLWEKIAGEKMPSLISTIVIGALLFIVFLCGLIPACFGLKKTKGDEGMNIKCYLYYLEGLEGIRNWLAKLDFEELIKKGEELKEWDEKLGEKISKEDGLTEYLCAEVAAPTLIFSIFIFAGIVMFCKFAFPILLGSDGGNNDSAKENADE